MLVLSRKSGEKIHVGDEVVIEIKKITGSRVTVAIDAPREIRILRGELKETGQAEEKALETASATGESCAPRETAAHDQPAPVPPPLQTFLVAHHRVDPADIGPGLTQ